MANPSDGTIQEYIRTEALDKVSGGHNHPDPQFSVELSVYEWHILLNELQHNMSVINRDTTDAKFLWEKIATKLNGK